VPPGTEIGIDMNSWNIGDKFRGIIYNSFSKKIYFKRKNV